jgi:hypothetical protein
MIWALMIVTPLMGPPEITHWPSPIRCREALARQAQVLAAHNVPVLYSECRVMYPHRGVKMIGEIVR